MATTVYDTFEIKLSNGDEIEIRPLSIKNLKKFMEIIAKLNDESINSEADAMEIFIDAAMLCMKQFKPELAEDKDLFEETIEVPTMMKILEIAGGMKFSDPNLLAADLNGVM